MTVYEKKYNWKNQRTYHWKYKGKNNPCSDPKYVKDRKKFFAKNGNGWWWGWKLVPPDKRPINLWSGKQFLMDDCRYCGGNCENEPKDSKHLCDGFSGDIDGLYNE